MYAHTKFPVGAQLCGVSPQMGYSCNGDTVVMTASANIATCLISGPTDACAVRTVSGPNCIVFFYLLVHPTPVRSVAIHHLGIREHHSRANGNQVAFVPTHVKWNYQPMEAGDQEAGENDNTEGEQGNG